MEVANATLVTGANGFIGRVLCASLRKNGLSVRAFLRKETTGPWDESMIGDLAAGSLPPGCLSGVDTVSHLAGKAHALAETGADESAYQQINVEGTHLLLEAAMRADVRRFIFFSSVKAAGECSEAAQDETSRCPPETPYGRSKQKAEVLVMNSTIPHVTVLRPSMVYGPDNPGNLGRMISATNNGYFPPFPRIDNQRSMVHVEDVVQAAFLAAENPRAHRQTYIITDGQTYSTRQIYQWVCHALGKSIPTWTVPLSVLRGLARIGDTIGALRGKRFVFDSDTLAKLTGSAAYSSDKIRRELGFAPRLTLDQALSAIVQPYKQEK